MTEIYLFFMHFQTIDFPVLIIFSILLFKKTIIAAILQNTEVKFLSQPPLLVLSQVRSARMAISASTTTQKEPTNHSGLSQTSSEPLPNSLL